MTIYPAIDLISARAVRLEKGDYTKKTEYSDNPVEVAQRFEAAGARYIHIVDLDGAKAKKPVNTEVVRAISEAVNIPIQVGGGLRSLEAAGELLRFVDRVIIGTVAISEPQILKQLVEKFTATRIIVSVDYKNGSPAVNGWLETTSLKTDDLQSRLKNQGVETVIVTDTDKDGLMRGPNIELMRQWRQAGFEIICAGGVTTADDINALKAAGIDGAIIGKALYEAKITLKEALDAC